MGGEVCVENKLLGLMESSVKEDVKAQVEVVIEVIRRIYVNVVGVEPHVVI